MRLANPFCQDALLALVGEQEARERKCNNVHREKETQLTSSADLQIREALKLLHFFVIETATDFLLLGRALLWVETYKQYQLFVNLSISTFRKWADTCGQLIHLPGTLYRL